MKRHIHFVGIGGVGLSALAAVMLARGNVISGSDPNATAQTRSLAQQGATIYQGHAGENVNGADLIVTTSAAHADNPELLAARALGIPVLKRREFLRQMTEGYSVIAVAGSHGKTTTTAMIGVTLEAAGLDPTVIVGGVVPEWNSNARAGQGEWFVIEADEYDYAFLGLEPTIAVVTNVDYDHPDLFATSAAYQSAFAEFLEQVKSGGTIVVCGDEPTARTLALASGRTVRTYGLGADNALRAAEMSSQAGGGIACTVRQDDKTLGRLELTVPGAHNVLNALGAIGAAQLAGASFAQAKQALEGYGGVARRFQVRGAFHGAILIDDYAHHPTEIRATLRAARQRYPQKRIWAVFQPHTYSRTRALLDEFAACFGDADRVLVTQVYAAREQNDMGFSAQELVRRIETPPAQFVSSLAAAEEVLRAQVMVGDVVLALGAGDVNQVVERLSRNENA